MLLYTVDIHLSNTNSQGEWLSNIQKTEDITIINMSQLFEDLGSMYYRIEFLGDSHSKKNIELLLAKENLNYKFKIEELPLSNRMIEQIPSKRIQIRKALSLSSEKILQETIQKQFQENHNIKQLTKQRVGMLSDGKSNVLPWTTLPRLERDAFILNKYAKLYAEPLWVNTKHDEDFVKTTISLAQNFRILRISSMHTENAFDVFDRIQKSIDIPVVNADYTESAILIVASLKNAIAMNGGGLKNKRIAILGIDIAALGILDLLNTESPERITGVDSNFRQLSIFEKRGGMASSIDNVYSSADAIIVMPSFQSILDEKKFRPGQVILNFRANAFSVEHLAREMRKTIFSGLLPHPACILPGLLMAIIKADLPKLEIEHAIKMVNTLLKKDNTPSLLPLPSKDLFSKQENAFL